LLGFWLLAAASAIALGACGSAGSWSVLCEDNDFDGESSCHQFLEDGGFFDAGPINTTGAPPCTAEQELGKPCNTLGQQCVEDFDCGQLISCQPGTPQSSCAECDDCFD
jgi:hypothetical protein